MPLRSVVGAHRNGKAGKPFWIPWAGKPRISGIYRSRTVAIGGELRLAGSVGGAGVPIGEESRQKRIRALNGLGCFY